MVRMKMSVEEFDRYNDNSLILMFVFGIPICVFSFIFIFPELFKMPEWISTPLGFFTVLSILFIPPKIAYFVLRKSNPYTSTKIIKGNDK